MTAVAVVTLLPDTAIAQVRIPFLGPIIPEAIRTCPASFAMVIDVINRIILFSITILIVFVAPLMIAYAGFLMVVNPFNAGGIGRARGILLNMVVGLVIALAGWLIVSAIMAVLYRPSDPWPAWHSIINSGGLDPCLKQAGSLGGLRQAPTIVSTSPAGVNTLAFGSGACSADVVLAAAKASGYNLTQAQANTFACLAQPESTCGSRPQNYSWNKGNAQGKASTAYGAFQVLLSSNHACFENKVCYEAARVAGPLNCNKGFDANGFTAGGNPKILAACLKAAENLTCNTAAAACVLQKQGFGAWTKDPKSVTAQNRCIADYSI